MSISKYRYSSFTKLQKIILVTIFIIIALILEQYTWAQVGNRSGKVVVEAVCATCHDLGTQGAPKIGDVKAWNKRASQGLTTLTQHAISGIRQMPAHGGNPGITDFEIKRAVTYMVNQSGGSWTQPIDKGTPLAERSGEQVVQIQCVKCHQTGEGGAPKIGDRAEWILRLKQGLNTTILSAINGHGGMPPRGGMANLTDTELKSAVIYMFNPVSTPTKKSPVIRAAESDDHHKVTGGMAIYLGIAPVQSMRAAESALHGGIPNGRDYYHVNVSLRDSTTQDQISDAQVELTVNDPVMGSETKALEPMTINKMISYGNYFRLTGRGAHSVTVHIQTPGMSRAMSTSFNIRRD